MTPVEYLLNARAMADGRPYNASQWVVETPQVESLPGAKYGFRLSLNPKVDSGLYGKFIFHYDKTSWTNLGTVKLDGPLTKGQFLAFLTDLYGVDVTQADFANVLPDDMLESSYSLPAHMNSILFRGTLDLQLL